MRLGPKSFSSGHSRSHLHGPIYHTRTHTPDKWGSAVRLEAHPRRPLTSLICGAHWPGTKRPGLLLLGPGGEWIRYPRTCRVKSPLTELMQLFLRKRIGVGNLYKTRGSSCAANYASSSHTPRLPSESRGRERESCELPGWSEGEGGAGTVVLWRGLLVLTRQYLEHIGDRRRQLPHPGELSIAARHPTTADQPLRPVNWRWELLLQLRHGLVIR
jgi:hypothetical protein